MAARLTVIDVVTGAVLVQTGCCTVNGF